MKVMTNSTNEKTGKTVATMPYYFYTGTTCVGKRIICVKKRYAVASCDNFRGAFTSPLMRHNWKLFHIFCHSTYEAGTTEAMG